jgi:hypothetical protein
MRSLGVAVVFLAAGAVSAGAQDTRTEPPKGRFRVGLIRITPKLELKNAGRDTNVLLDPASGVADSSIAVRGGTDAFFPVGRRGRLFAKGWLDWSYYRSLKTERSTDPGGEGRAEFDFGPWTVFGGGGALRARQLFSIDLDARVLREEHFASAGAQWRFSSRAFLSGRIEQRRYRYDPDRRLSSAGLAAATLDRDAITTGLALRYRLTSMTTAVARTEVLDDAFTLALPRSGTTRSFRHLAGVELGPKALLSGYLLAGIRESPAGSRGTLPAYRGPALSAELAYPFLRRARLVANAQRELFVSATQVVSAEERGRNAYVFTSARGAFDVFLPMDLFGRFSVGWDRARYLLPLPVGDVSMIRVDQFHTVGGALFRQLSDTLRVGVTMTRYRRTSSIPGLSYRRWVYGLSAEFVP